jgi:5-methylcytosine-specific restriction enzyme A
MPIVPRNAKCAELGCKNQRAKRSQFCTEHGGKDTYVAVATDDRRKFNSMYNQQGWKRLRAAQLSKQPLCAGCLSRGHIRGADTVDHVFSWSHIGKQAFFDNLFQSLCPDCHAEKTQLERTGKYRHYHSHTHTDYDLNQYASVCRSQHSSE